MVRGEEDEKSTEKTSAPGTENRIRKISGDFPAAGSNNRTGVVQNPIIKPHTDRSMGRPAVVVMVVNGSVCYFIAFFTGKFPRKKQMHLLILQITDL